MPGITVAWNEIVNYPNQSLVNENISLYDAGGTSSSPAEFHDNYIQGAYPYNPATDSYNGGGFTTDGDPTSLAPPQVAPQMAPRQLSPQIQISPQILPQARADDGYIYPADGSSTDQRYPAPRTSRRVYDGQVYYQQQQQPAYDRYGNSYQQPRSTYQQQPGYYYPN